MFFYCNSGFERLCGGIGALFRSDELESLVVGAPTLDFHALQANCSYEDGLCVDDPLATWFWAVVHDDLCESRRRRLLCFCTVRLFYLLYGQFE